MPRWLFNAICTLTFAGSMGAGILLAWLLVIDRPHPTGLDADAAMLVAFALLLGAAVAMLLSSRVQGRRRWH
ncbi:MAG: hypothetical protein WAP03_15910 [Methylorubrum rhodinum]|uniref:hypothetical protein n=1 Tax=Methylorubrum rhodinum TaxID=29428 RepID=UPI003BB10617